jgi:5'-3' exoribonuclease 2
LVLSVTAEERQDQNAKRRKIDQQNRSDFSGLAGPSQTLALTAPPTAPTTNTSSATGHHPLPQRPSYDFGANADSMGLGAAPTAESIQHAPTAAQALAGSNRDVVQNRRAIRMANMSAAEVLKAELSGLSPVKQTKSAVISKVAVVQNDVGIDIPGLGVSSRQNDESSLYTPDAGSILGGSDVDADGDPDPDAKMGMLDSEGANGHEADVSIGEKRKYEDGPGDDTIDEIVAIEEDEEEATVPALKVNADGTVEQEDTVK